jgi:hypothetical protein
MKTPRIYAAEGTEVIQERLYNGPQSINFEGIYKIKEERFTTKLRVLIRRDSSDSQGCAEVQSWGGSDKGWVFVASLDITECDSHQLFYQTKAENLKGQEIDWIGTDTDQLIELAKEIIF